MGVFFEHENQLIEMHETPYEAEQVLQQLLADFPGLLAGDGDGSTHRWLLVQREAALPDEQDGIARWSVDHLFVDGEAIPTIVEVKRSSDSRLRREVVGQMLDYAANATAYWRSDRLRSYFEARCDQANVAPSQVLRETLHVEDGESFWANVDTNLSAGRVRLVFVGDHIPSELRRIVEYLNQEMAMAEVLAIEIKQYVESEGDRRTLVSRTIGQTEEARQRKSGSSRETRSWDENSLLQDLEERRGEHVVEILRKILSWADSHTPPLEIQYGSGKSYSSMQFGIADPGYRIFPFFVYSTGYVEIQFQLMTSYPYAPFDSLEKRLELKSRLDAIEGVEIDPQRIDRRPSFDLDLLSSANALQRFLDAMDWCFDEAALAGGSSQS